MIPTPEPGSIPVSGGKGSVLKAVAISLALSLAGATQREVVGSVAKTIGKGLFFPFKKTWEFIFPGSDIGESDEVEKMVPKLDPTPLPNVKLENYIGEEGSVKNSNVVKRMIKQYTHPEHYPKKNRAFLFSGEPGNGKTYLAECIAGECKEKGLNPTFYAFGNDKAKNPFVGMSSKIMTKMMKRVRQAGATPWYRKVLRKVFGQPIDDTDPWYRKIFRRTWQRPIEKEIGILFLDEFDSMALERKKDDKAGNTNLALITTLLRELDNNNPLNKNKKTLVLCATNREELIDGAIKRPGRLKIVRFHNPIEAERNEHLQGFIAEKANEGEIFEQEANDFITNHMWKDRHTGDFSIARLKDVIEEAADFRADRAAESEVPRNQLEITLEDLKSAIRETLVDKGCDNETIETRIDRIDIDAAGEEALRQAQDETEEGGAEPDQEKTSKLEEEITIDEKTETSEVFEQSRPNNKKEIFKEMLSAQGSQPRKKLPVQNEETMNKAIIAEVLGQKTAEKKEMNKKEATPNQKLLSKLEKQVIIPDKTASQTKILKQKKLRMKIV